MNIFIRKEEVERLRAAKEDSFQKLLYTKLLNRCKKNTAEDKWVQEDDTQLWYHLAWERMSDAAFVYAVEKDEKIGKWIKNRVAEIMKLTVDEWVGPDFREDFRSMTAKRQIGALETGHVTLALCEAYVNAGDLFSEDEKKAIIAKLLDTAIPLCRGFLEVTLTTERTAHYGNWTTVLSNALGVASIVAGNREELEFALNFADMFSEQYSKNDFGETLQYSNYASLHLSNLYEIAMRTGVAKDIDISHIENLMPWYAESLLYMKPIDSVGMAPRCINFGDSAALFRPSGNVLTLVSKYGKNKINRGLASYLLHLTYSKEVNMPDELATFGFLNQFEYLAVLNAPDCAEEISPKEAKLPLDMRVESGIIISRDSWDDTRTTVAIMGGFDANAPVYTKAGHRHCDQNSFTVTVGKERILADSGHCNYRSEAYEFSRRSEAHTIPQIYTENGKLAQTISSGAAAHMRLLGNQLICDRWYGDVHVIASDAAFQYDYSPTTGEYPNCNILRIWVMRLPNIILVTDYVRITNRPLKLGATFVVNQRDNKTKTERRRNDRELYITRHGEGLRLFCGGVDSCGETHDCQLSSYLGYMHDFYHPLENQVCQGREGSAMIYSFKSPEFSVRNVITYAIAADKAANLDNWELDKNGSETFVRSKTTGEFVSLSFDLGRVTVKTEKGENVFNPYFSEKYSKLSERKVYTGPIFAL